ncbi:MAG: hypothetical protein H6835_15865 [Planctomycetes bacterium]|nr:hypothetical protein [Planctomycetota bacterium]
MTVSPLRHGDRGYAAEVLLLETGGALPGPGRLLRCCRFAAAHVPAAGIFDAEVAVLVAADAAGAARSTSRVLDAAAARELVAAIDESGFAARVPDVRERPDTSDHWRRLVLQVQLDDRVTRLDLLLQSSGFEGPDAGALQALLDRLFG